MIEPHMEPPDIIDHEPRERWHDNAPPADEVKPVRTRYVEACHPMPAPPKQKKQSREDTLRAFAETVALEAALYSQGQIESFRRDREFLARHGVESAYSATAFERGVNCARRLLLRGLIVDIPSLRGVIRDGIRTGIKSAKRAHLRRKP